MAYVAGEFLERLPTFGHIPFGHGELPSLGMMHLYLARLAFLSRDAKGARGEREDNVEQKTRLHF
jgi:hypothetical protein